MRNELFRILKSQLLPMAAGPGVLLFFYQTALSAIKGKLHYCRYMVRAIDLQ
jgi:hypothetical protein